MSGCFTPAAENKIGQHSPSKRANEINIQSIKHSNKRTNKYNKQIKNEMTKGTKEQSNQNKNVIKIFYLFKLFYFLNILNILLIYLLLQSIVFAGYIGLAAHVLCEDKPFCGDKISAGIFFFGFSEIFLDKFFLLLCEGKILLFIDVG